MQKLIKIVQFSSYFYKNVINVQHALYIYPKHHSILNFIWVIDLSRANVIRPYNSKTIA